MCVESTATANDMVHTDQYRNVYSVHIVNLYCLCKNQVGCFNQGVVVTRGLLWYESLIA